MLDKIKYYIKNNIYRKTSYPVGINKYLKKNKEISLIDIGAYEGEFTDLINNYCGISKAILLEPLLEKYNLLTSKYNNSNIKIYNNAVSSECGISIFNVNHYEYTSSLLKFQDSLQELSNINTNLKDVIKSNTITLDRLFQDLHLSEIDLVKIDVQGAEHLVLFGGRESLKKIKYICIEVSLKEIYQDSYLFHDIYNFLSENNFILLEFEPVYRSANKEILQADTLFRRL